MATHKAKKIRERRKVFIGGVGGGWFPVMKDASLEQRRIGNSFQCFTLLKKDAADYVDARGRHYPAKSELIADYVAIETPEVRYLVTLHTQPLPKKGQKAGLNPIGELSGRERILKITGIKITKAEEDKCSIDLRKEGDFFPIQYATKSRRGKISNMAFCSRPISGIIAGKTSAGENMVPDDEAPPLDSAPCAVTLTSGAVCFAYVTKQDLTKDERKTHAETLTREVQEKAEAEQKPKPKSKQRQHGPDNRKPYNRRKNPDLHNQLCGYFRKHSGEKITINAAAKWAEGLFDRNGGADGRGGLLCRFKLPSNKTLRLAAEEARMAVQS